MSQSPLKHGARAVNYLHEMNKEGHALIKETVVLVKGTAPMFQKSAKVNKMINHVIKTWKIGHSVNNAGLFILPSGKYSNGSRVKHLVHVNNHKSLLPMVIKTMAVLLILRHNCLQVVVIFKRIHAKGAIISLPSLALEMAKKYMGEYCRPVRRKRLS